MTMCFCSHYYITYLELCTTDTRDYDDDVHIWAQKTPIIMWPFLWFQAIAPPPTCQQLLVEMSRHSTSYLWAANTHHTSRNLLSKSDQHSVLPYKVSDLFEGTKAFTNAWLNKGKYKKDLVGYLITVTDPIMSYSKEKKSFLVNGPTLISKNGQCFRGF